MFPFSSSTPVPGPVTPDPGAQQPVATDPPVSQPVPPPEPTPDVASSLPPLSAQPVVTPAAGEIPAGGAVQFEALPVPDPALAQPQVPVAEAAPVQAETPPLEAGLAVQTDAPPASTEIPVQAAQPASDAVATFPAGDIADEVKTMTTKEAIKILHELLEIGEFLKVRNGALDVLQVDPTNQEAMRLRDESQALLDNPQEVQRLQEASRAQRRQRKIVITTASVFMMGALGLEGWAFFGETPLQEVTQAPIVYEVMIKSDPIKTEGDAPFTVTFNVRADIPSGVTVLFDSGDGATKAPPYTRTFVKPGTYDVKAVATGPKGELLSEDTQQVIVTERLTTDMTATPGIDGDSLTVVFTSSVSGSGVQPATYSWDFGDGRNDTAANPTHTYEKAGVYQVKLVVSRADGGHGEVTKSVEVFEPIIPTDIPPTTIEPPSSVVPSSVPTLGAVDAIITTIPKSVDGRTISGTAPFTVYFSSGSSRSENGQLSSAYWNFGDHIDSSDLSVFHTYSRPGLYKVKLTVSDTAGVTGTEDLTINVRAASASTTPSSGPITIKIQTDVPLQGTVPFAVTFDAGGSTSSAGSITGYEWEFGDGSTLGSGARVSHVFQSAGKYTVTLTATDERGTEAKKILTVTAS